jgi:type I restriction enzyme M protein
MAKSEFTKPLETATRKKIDLILANLGWKTDESSPDCNVFTERAKTVEQNKKLKRKSPDYVLYKSNTDEPIGIIETKRSGQSLQQALDQAVKFYAIPLGMDIVFVTDGSIVESYDVRSKLNLKLDDQIITEFISEKQLLQFLEYGSQLYSPEKVIYTKRELIKIFSEAEELLRKEGMREGIERFTEFSNLLFLKLISEIEEDRENNGEKRILEKKYCWDSFYKLPPEQMLEYINGTILPRLVNKYNHSSDVFQKELLIRNPKNLKKIVDKLSSLKLLDTDSDIKGDAFEYFLKNSVSVGTDLGEYFTPRHIVKIIVDLVDPKFEDKIYDPACGTGGFLIEAFRHIKSKCKQTKRNLKILKEKTVFGREISGTAKIAKMNMIIIGDGHNNIRQMDSLENPISARKKYNVVLTNFPFSQTTDFSYIYGFNSEDANPVFLKHIIDALDKDGIAGIVVPEGLLFDENAEYIKIRRILLETCDVIAVIKLHEFVFKPYTGQPTSILIFRKGTPTKKVWFFDVEEDGFKKTGSKLGRKPIKADDLILLRQSWNDKEKSSHSLSVDIKTITKEHYKLSMDKYIGGKRNRSFVKLGECCDVVML